MSGMYIINVKKTCNYDHALLTHEGQSSPGSTEHASLVPARHTHTSDPLPSASAPHATPHQKPLGFQALSWSLSWSKTGLHADLDGAAPRPRALGKDAVC